jgi:hypothetical protein
MIGVAIRGQNKARLNGAALFCCLSTGGHMDSLHTTSPMEVVFRPAVILPAAGAYDPAPLELQTFNCEWLSLFFAYTRGGAGGAFDFQVQVSPRLIDSATLQNWFPISLYDAGALAAGADTQSRFQREYMTYQATGAGVETFTFGALHISRNVARVRVACRESGAVATPGTLHIIGVLGY